MPAEPTGIRASQAGVLTRAQALTAGYTIDAIRARLATGRWQRIQIGVYLTYSGPAARDSQLWAAVLGAGPGATLSHQTAAQLWGFAPWTGGLIHVTVPSRRRVQPPPGAVVHRSARIDQARHPSRLPPLTRVEDTVLDLVQQAGDLDEAIDWVTRACSRRLTLPGRLLGALEGRSRVSWRAELTAALSDVAEGCHSPLERRYLQRVERVHKLPVGRRQAPRAVAALGSDHPGRRYDDVRYEPWQVVVELDGRIAHPDPQRWRDMRRDNAVTEGGGRSLRYGWADVVSRSCAVAAQVAGVLRESGWPGRARSCSTNCVVDRQDPARA